MKRTQTLELISFENYDCRYNYSDKLSRRKFGKELYDLELQKNGDKSQVFKFKVTAAHILARLCSTSTPGAAGQYVPENSAWTLAPRLMGQHFQDC